MSRSDSVVGEGEEDDDLDTNLDASSVNNVLGRGGCNQSGERVQFERGRRECVGTRLGLIRLL